MDPVRDFDAAADEPPQAEDLVRDLALDTLFDAMAGGDAFLRGVARIAVLTSLRDPTEVRYRQRVLSDCLAHPSVIAELHATTVDAIDVKKKDLFAFFKGSSPGSVLHASVRHLQGLVPIVRRLRSIADAHADDFRSEGFRRFFAMVQDELDDTYLASVEDHLNELRFRRGVLMSAELGRGNKGTRYTLHRSREGEGWLRRILDRDREPYHSFQLAARDESGARILAELRDRGIEAVADALARSTDHITNFFRSLQTELAFYRGCMNLHERLVAKGEPTCVPTVRPAGEGSLSAQGLYDVCLSLRLGTRAQGNDVDADGKHLVVITGANRGGKSTFLRSVGLAQLVMQCGMFVPARTYRASIVPGLFTHFKREEDASLKSGKLDEELRRMRSTIDLITAHAMLLANESFASTNEREGSEIARQVISALVDSDVRVLLVTHLFDLANSLDGTDGTLFLRAERGANGARTFRLTEAEPLPTSHGGDVYLRVFGRDLKVSADEAP
jgi:hypothetical protein